MYHDRATHSHRDDRRRARRAGCGADPAPTASKPKPADMPIQRYVTEVAGLGQAIDDARSDYFHAERTRAAVKHGTADVQAAYADAASGLADIDPPAVAAELHQQLDARHAPRTWWVKPPRSCSTCSLDLGGRDGR